MLIIFGWQKRVDFIRSTLSAYCYNCQKDRDWGHFRESEWASLFFVRLVPFNLKHHLVCEGCRDDLILDRRAKQKADELARATEVSEQKWLQAGFSKLIEQHQLKHKTEAQKQYIQSIREQNSQLRQSNE